MRPQRSDRDPASRILTKKLEPDRAPEILVVAAAAALMFSIDYCLSGDICLDNFMLAAWPPIMRSPDLMETNFAGFWIMISRVFASLVTRDINSGWSSSSYMTI